MAKTIVAQGYGGPENLAVVDIDPGLPGPGEVLIEVRAAGVNPIDAKIYGGGFGTDPQRLPLRLGHEVAGVVLATGPGATGPAGPVRVGDEVVAFRISGGYTELLVAPAADVLPKPAALSWEAAAGLLLAGTTAVHALSVIEPAAGDTLLVHGAAGGVGLMVVQLATGRDVHVIGTASPGHHGAVRELGARAVTYGRGLTDRVHAELAETGWPAVTGAVDTVGTDEAVDTSLELIGDPRRVVTIASFGHGAAKGIIRIGGGPGADPGTHIRAAARLELVRSAEQGKVSVQVAGVYSLDRAADAHRAQLGRHAPGKIVLVP